MRNIKGFTLIELLVVVLIIGILAGIALPQYQKAVWKSRSAELQQLLRSFANAEEAHWLYNNNYTNDFDALDISFPSLPLTSIPSAFNWSYQATRANDNTALLNNSVQEIYGRRLMAFFRNGKYAGGTFIYFVRQSTTDIGTLKRGQIYCAEVYSPDSPAHQNGFCKNIMGITAAPISWNGAKYYEMK